MHAMGVDDRQCVRPRRVHREMHPPLARGLAVARDDAPVGRQRDQVGFGHVLVGQLPGRDLDPLALARAHVARRAGDEPEPQHLAAGRDDLSAQRHS